MLNIYICEDDDIERNNIEKIINNVIIIENYDMNIELSTSSPNELLKHLQNAVAIGTLEKDISFGYEGTVYTNVNSALHKGRNFADSYDFIGGIGGRDISKEIIRECFTVMINQETDRLVRFVGLEVEDDVR